MRITLNDTGKRFNRDWIFRHLSYEFNAGSSYAITGPNGSGKSTLLQVIAGSIASSEGSLRYELTDDLLSMSEKNKHSGAGNQLSTEDIYQYISLSAPYLEVIEEMTLIEFLQFHQTFKPFLPGLTIEEMIAMAGLQQASHKQIRYYSSGMKQRVKLAQAVFTDTPVVLLDEPCTNLDAEGIALYQQLIADYCSNRLVIVSSNDIQEFKFCDKRIDMLACR